METLPVLAICGSLREDSLHRALLTAVQQRAPRFRFVGAELIRDLESQIDAFGTDWPKDLFLFVSRITPLVNVDLLIQDSIGRTLLTWRSDRFFGPGWHVPGGIIRYKEPAAERVRKVAKAELGIDVTFDAAPMAVHESIASARRNRAHGISLLYRCQAVGNPDPARRYVTEHPLPGQWHWHQRCPPDLIEEQRAYAAYLD
jgi:colanic acid biosynthesis protein WcaH